MKIALVVPGGVDRSGEYRVIPALLSLIGRLAKRHEIHVFALHQESREARWTLHGAQIHNIGDGRRHLRAVRAICAEHRRAKFQLIQAFWAGAPSLVSWAAASFLRLPFLVHVAGGELASIPDIGYGGMRSWRGRLREPWVLGRAAAVTAASAPLVSALTERGIRATRLPLGVDLERWPPRAARRRRPSERARLIHIASLNRVKDQATLLQGLALLAKSTEFHLDIVGEDTLHGEIQALAGRLGLSASIKFHGFLPQLQLRPLVEAADLAIITSRHEAGPLAVLEAAVAGVPTVGTAVGHIAEFAPRAARAVPVADAPALAAALGELLVDEDSRLGLAQNALTLATHQDADFTAREFESLYQRLAGGEIAGTGSGSPSDAAMPGARRP